VVIRPIRTAIHFAPVAAAPAAVVVAEAVGSAQPFLPPFVPADQKAGDCQLRLHDLVT